VDFNTAQLLGQTLNIAKPKTRLLTSTRKKAMCQYCIKLNHRLQAQNIYQRVNKLHARYKTQTAHTQWMEDQAEILDDYITTCMLIAESTIHSHNLDDFSPKSQSSKCGNFLEASLPGQPKQHTNSNTTSGKDHVKISKHGHNRPPRHTFNSG
jgi:hypothetical protein